MRTALKRFLIAGHCYGYIPAGIVTWAFRVFRLRSL